MNTLGTLSPVFLIVLLGYALRRSGFLPRSFFQGVNRLTFYIGLPALLFHKIAETPTLDADALSLFVVLGVVTLCLLIIGAGAAVALRVKRPAAGSMIQAAFRGNNVFVGLPVVFYATANEPTAARYAELAVLALAPMIPLYNLLSLGVLLPLGDRHPGSPGKLVLKAITNPLTLACVLGGLAAAFLPPLPAPITRTTSTLGQMALPLALLGIGASLTREGLRRGGAAATFSSLIKVALGPALVLVLLPWIPLSTEARLVALVMAACPTAVASYVFSEQMGGDEDIAAGCVVVSTVMAAIALPLAVLL